MEAATLTPVDLEHFVSPKILSPEQQELISIHHHLNRIHFLRLLTVRWQGREKSIDESEK